MGRGNNIRVWVRYFGVLEGQEGSQAYHILQHSFPCVIVVGRVIAGVAHAGHTGVVSRRVFCKSSLKFLVQKFILQCSII